MKTRGHEIERQQAETGSVTARLMVDAAAVVARLSNEHVAVLRELLERGAA